MFNDFGFVKKVLTSKTVLTLYRSTQRVLNFETVLLQGCPTPLFPISKCLGLTLHENLKWGPHISSLSPKCYSIIASLSRLRDVGVPTKGLIFVIKSLFIPVLCYALWGAFVWGAEYKIDTSRAQVVLKDALRAIFGKRRRVGGGVQLVTCIRVDREKLWTGTSCRQGEALDRNECNGY